MIIQTYELGSWAQKHGQKDKVIYFDQATQVKQYRMSYEKLDGDYPASSRQENFTGYIIIDNTIDPAGRRDVSKGYVRAVHWNDRITGQPYILFSDEDVFILNDEGKTFVRV